ncbi:MAG: hypothetical protein NTW86_18030 [Candidatus Sumerlaeota bacterium]|nr:hypothetical protein [Candidatus Sumerlaeota bacterium]
MPTSDYFAVLVMAVVLLACIRLVLSIARMKYEHDARLKTNAAHQLDADEVETLRRLVEKLNRMEERIRNLETILIDAEWRSRI